MMTDNLLLLDEEKAPRPSTQTLRWNFAPAELLGRSAAAEQLRNLIRKVAPTDATVLVRGESGTGKDFIARLIAQHSPRAQGPFLHVDCAAVPEEQLEQKLFGEPQGRLSNGASSGAFELARGGTVLLEEIGALPPAVQGRLLEVLQNQPFESSDGSSSDVRLLATTNRDLEAMVQRGGFREDLLHALSIVRVPVPSLRERREDIGVLAEHFRQLYARKHGLEVLAISPACLELLQKYSWPGNIRELETLLERAVIICQSGVVEAKHLQFVPQAAALAGGGSEEASLESEELAEAEKKHIFAILRRCQGNRTHAAKRLGISIRTLRNKLREYRQQAGDNGAENPLLAAVG